MRLEETFFHGDILICDLIFHSEKQFNRRRPTDRSVAFSKIFKGGKHFHSYLPFFLSQ